MTKVPKQEVQKIAWLSRIALADNEIDVMNQQLQEVLTYAHCLCEAGADVTIMTRKNINVFREDVTAPCDEKPIMAQAPESMQNFFVVPKVLETKE